MNAFCGSYLPGDVSFLLKRIEQAEPVADLEAKERLIQSGARHYSEMISIERAPSAAYLRLFHQAVDDNLGVMARDLLHLVREIAAQRAGEEVVLVSLARAGTPVGVALRRLFARLANRDVPHYSISIIRDRGIDAVALEHVCRLHDPRSIVFVDGWTGKGTISGELQSSLAVFNRSRAEGKRVRGDLFVLADLAGTSAGCGSTDDYLIPSSILNATVSGLVSRTILDQHVGPGDFHGCLYYEHLGPQDLSRWFIDRLVEAALALQGEPLPAAADRPAAAARTAALVRTLMDRYGVGDRNFIKPGIGEATRSLLRRAPRVVFLRSGDDASTAHLRMLAREREIPVEIVPSLPLRAASVIKDLGHA